MNAKVNFVVGVDAAGKLHNLYLGTDGGAAKEAYTAAVNGAVPDIVHVQLFIRPNYDRRRNVESVALPADSAPETKTKKPKPKRNGS